MPVIVAKRRSNCAACKLPIEVDERIDYEASRGARHLACTDRHVERLNQYPMTCALCGAFCGKGRAKLELLSDEQQPDGTWKKTYRGTCKDGCPEARTVHSSNRVLMRGALGWRRY